MLMKLTEGRTYVDVLGKIRNSVDPENTQTEVKMVIRTRAGDVLDTRRQIFWAEAVVRQLKPMATVEIRDVDCLTTVEGVKEAIDKMMPEYNGDLKVSLSRKNRELKLCIYTSATYRRLHLK